MWTLSKFLDWMQQDLGAFDPSTAEKNRLIEHFNTAQIETLKYHRQLKLWESVGTAFNTVVDQAIYTWPANLRDLTTLRLGTEQLFPRTQRQTDYQREGLASDASLDDAYTAIEPLNTLITTGTVTGSVDTSALTFSDAILVVATLGLDDISHARGLSLQINHGGSTGWVEYWIKDVGSSTTATIYQALVAAAVTLPFRLRVRNPRFQLAPAPAEALAVAYSYLRWPHPLRNDIDTPDPAYDRMEMRLVEWMRSNAHRIGKSLATAALDRSDFKAGQSLEARADKGPNDVIFLQPTDSSWRVFNEFD